MGTVRLGFYGCLDVEYHGGMFARNCQLSIQILWHFGYEYILMGAVSNLRCDLLARDKRGRSSGISHHALRHDSAVWVCVDV